MIIIHNFLLLFLFSSIHYHRENVPFWETDNKENKTGRRTRRREEEDDGDDEEEEEEIRRRGKKVKKKGGRKMNLKRGRGSEGGSMTEDETDIERGSQTDRGKGSRGGGESGTESEGGRKKTQSARKSFLFCKNRRSFLGVYSDTEGGGRITSESEREESDAGYGPSSWGVGSEGSQMSFLGAARVGWKGGKEREGGGEGGRGRLSILVEGGEEEEEGGEGALGVCEEMDGSVLSGRWVEGEMVGYGMRVWVNGSEYVGEFVESRANGKGVLHSADGTWFVSLICFVLFCFCFLLLNCLIYLFIYFFNFRS